MSSDAPNNSLPVENDHKLEDGEIIEEINNEPKNQNECSVVESIVLNESNFIIQTRGSFLHGSLVETGLLNKT